MKYYGKLKFSEWASRWDLDVEPHVAIKVKRIFPRCSETSRTISIHDSEEVCRDLLWLMERYPLEMDPNDRDLLEGAADAHDQRAEDMAGLLSGTITPREFKLAIPPRSYQAAATEIWLRNKGLIVADALGLGKTCVAIAGVTRPEMQPALVVVQAHLQLQWAAELRKFAPGIKVHIIKSGKPYNILAGEKPKDVSPDQFSLFADDSRFPHVLIVTYYKLAGWWQTLAPMVKSVVFDEVQELRRSESAKYEAAERIAERATYRIGLSATPIFNFGGEMWNITNIVRPGALGSRYEFMREWCRDGDKGIVKNPKAFGTYLRDAGIMIRRTRADVGRELPPITKIPIEIDSDPKALKKMGGAAELARIILSQDENPLKKGQAARELDWKLRQATGIAKAPFLGEFVKMLLDSEEKVLLSAWHREVYDILMHRLRAFRPVLYTGSESIHQKDRARRAFVNGNSRVMLISNRSGAGLDGLQQVCHVGVVGELDWSPEVHDQLAGRLYRDGQDEGVVMYFPIANDGSDPVIADVLQLKKGQIVGIRDPKGNVVQGQAADPNHIRKLAEHYLRSK